MSHDPWDNPDYRNAMDKQWQQQQNAQRNKQYEEPPDTYVPEKEKSSGDSCFENVVGMIIFGGIVLLIIIAAWQDPTNQGKVCLGLFFGPLILLFVVRRRWRKKQGRTP